MVTVENIILWWYGAGSRSTYVWRKVSTIATGTVHIVHLDGGAILISIHQKWNCCLNYAMSANKISFNTLSNIIFFLIIFDLIG